MDAIVIMAKEPVPSQVKTRLIPHLKPETASGLYYNFLLDKIEQVRSIEKVHPFIAYTPPDALVFFRNIAPSGFGLICQPGTGLGERLVNISRNLFELGFKKVVMLDSDTPNLPAGYIREGLDRLNRVDIVLGPCEDGGYYLIGMRSYTPGIFEGIPWSTPEVAELTLKKARSLGLTVSQLGIWYDVDTVEDLMRLKSDLFSEDQKGSFFCENTCRAISGKKLGKDL